MYSISNCTFATGEKSGTPFLYSIPLIPASFKIFCNVGSGGRFRVHKDSPLAPSKTTFEFVSAGVCLNLESYVLANSSYLKAGGISASLLPVPLVSLLAKEETYRCYRK